MKLTDHLDKLAAFQIVAKNSTISAAANYLRITQPALSRQIQLLEEILNCQLIERSRKGIQLTAEGETLARFATRFLAEADALESRLQSGQKSIYPRLKIGTFESLAISVIPAVAEASLHKKVALVLSVITGSSAELHRALDVGEIDLLLGGLQNFGARHRYLWEMKDSFSFYCSPAFERRHRESAAVKTKQLLDHPIALVKNAETAEQTLEKSLAGEKLFFSRQFEVGTLEAAKNLALHHSALALLPRLVASPELRSGRLIETTIRGLRKKKIGAHSLALYVGSQAEANSVKELSEIIRVNIERLLEA